jgi:large subunit ribosomal protein L5
LILKQNIKTISEIPKVTKIVINTSSKLIVNEKKHLTPILLALELITGQKPKITKAKKSIATFKLRENQVIGCKVTMRDSNMLIFFEKLNKILLPRLTDFQGLNFEKKSSGIEKSIGNIDIGINNFLIFPELENYFEYFEYRGGMDINIQTSAKTKRITNLFFSGFQYPLQSK